MKLLINGRPREARSTTLAALVEEFGFQAACVATALNGEFVPREERDRIELGPGDRVEVLAPMQGG